MNVIYLWLKISVAYTCIMAALHSIYQLPHVEPSLGFRELPLLHDPIEQLPPLH